MSDDAPQDPGTGESPADPIAPDPFTIEDPEARAREERRLEREQRRREGGKVGRGGRGPFGRRRKAKGDGVPPPTTGEGEAVAPPSRSVTGEHSAPSTAEQAAPSTAEHAGPSTAEYHPATPAEQTRVQRARAGVRRRFPSRPSAGTVRRRRIIAVVGAVLVLLLVWFLVALFQPFGGDGSGKETVQIPDGAGASQVGEILERKGVISGGTPFVSGATLFRARLSLAGKSGDIQSGTYQLASGMSYGAAIDALTGGGSDGRSIVIPEGYTRDQIAEVTKDAGVKGNYKKVTLRSKKIDLEQYGAAKAPNLEGFLFPSTYELKKNAKVIQLVNQQLGEFQRQFKKVDMKYASSKNLTPYDVLKIASMIDKEVQIPNERKKVAEVIYNRLSTGEPLSIDATIRYATQNYDKPLTESELSIDSPYNTRLVAGLPPTPIGNPGLASIKAAANPSQGDLRFYVVKPGTCGKHFFTGSEEEFNKAAEEYQQALEEEGNSPTKC